MVLMLFLMLVLGFGLWSALGQATNTEGLLASTTEGHWALTPSHYLKPEPHPLNPDPVLLQPLWSG